MEKGSYSVMGAKVQCAISACGKSPFTVSAHTGTSAMVSRTETVMIQE